MAFVSEATNDQPEQLAQWFYSGKSGNGWWQYDDRTSKDIEEAFEDPEKKSVVISIVGFMYKIDFEVKIIKLPEVIWHVSDDEMCSNDDNFTLLIKLM